MSALEEELAQLKRADSIGDAAARLVGDLRNLLSPASVAIELMARRISPDDKELLTLVEHAAVALGAAGKLLRATVEYVYRPDFCGKKRVDPSELLSAMRPLLDCLVGDEVRLNIQRDVAHPLVDSGAIELERLFLNLICHARDAVKGRQINLEIRATTLTAAEAKSCGCSSGGEKVAIVLVADAPSSFRSIDRFDRDLALRNAERLAGDHGWGLKVNGEAGRRSICVYLPRVIG